MADSDRKSVASSRTEKLSDYDEEKNACTLRSPDQQSGQEVSSYPGLAECAPFPTLASLEEITHTLSRSRTNQTTQAPAHELAKDDPGRLAGKEEGDEEKAEKRDLGEAYWTEGIKNPGWLVVLSVFLVNFSMFGVVFSWGNFQQL